MNKRLRCTVSETTHDRIIELAQRLELEPRQVVERAVREYWESQTPSKSTASAESGNDHRRAADI